MDFSVNCDDNTKTHKKNKFFDFSHLFAIISSIFDFHQPMLEKDTRNFIDKKLLLTGYSLDHRQVVFEYPLNFQGKNFFLDYALFDTDGSVIALIEAKRYERSAKDGLFQALEYAQILESQQGFRPFIFLSNGKEIFFYNSSLQEPPRKVQTFFSLPDLQKLKTLQDIQVPPTSIQVNKDIA